MKNINVVKSLSENVNDIELYKCALIGNKCVTHFKDCSTYNNDKIINDEVERKTCESIKLYYPSNEYLRCFYEKINFV